MHGPSGQAGSEPDGSDTEEQYACVLEMSAAGIGVVEPQPALGRDLDP